MDRYKVEVYGSRIAKISNNQELQNEFYLKYNKFIDEFIYLNNKVYDEIGTDKEANRIDIETYIKDTIHSLKSCEKFLHDVEANEEFESEIEVPYKLECISCNTELKPYESNYCDKCYYDLINKLERENNLR